jgi:hypothetical protein
MDFFLTRVNSFKNESTQIVQSDVPERTTYQRRARHRLATAMIVVVSSPVSQLVKQAQALKVE